MEYHGISKLDLKRRNRMQILRVITERGPISRVDIATILEITRAAVTIITNEMIEEGVLFEVGEAPVALDNLQKGRRKILIDINPDFKFVVGASVSDTSVSIGITNLKAKAISKSSMDTSQETTCEQIISFIIKETEHLIKRCKFEKSDILGLGVSIQPELCGKMRIYYKDGKLDFSALNEFFSKNLDIPVFCVNSISALALSNQEPNIDERAGNYLFLKFGKNIHMSVLLTNDVMNEYLNHTNMIEKFIVNPGGKKLIGYPDGSVKAEITIDAIAEKYSEILSPTNTPIFWQATGGNIANINHKTITLAASKGDEKVLEVLNGILECVAILLNNLSAALFARYIVLHNFFLDEWLFDYFKKFISERYGDDFAKKIRVSRTESNMEFHSGCAIAIYEYFYKKGGII